jgi:hypothetical protein
MKLTEEVNKLLENANSGISSLFSNGWQVYNNANKENPIFRNKEFPDHQLQIFNANTKGSFEHKNVKTGEIIHSKANLNQLNKHLKTFHGDNYTTDFWRKNK